MKNYSFKQVLFFAIIAFSLQSCLSNKAFQTARVTPQGDKGFGFGITLPNAEFYTLDTAGVASDTTNLGGFTGEIYGRVGVMEKLDVGFNVSLLGTGGADVKYQFLGDSESQLAGSIGAGFGYLRFGAGDEDDQTTLLDITVPAYFSYHASDAFAVYLSPRYIFRKAGENSSNFGAVGGIRVGGERSGLFLEYGYLKSGDDAYNDQTNINIGFGIGIR